MEFGTLVRTRREAAKLSRNELGQMVGVTGTQIFRIETGARAPSLDVFRLLVRELDIPADEAVRADMPSPSPAQAALSEVLTSP
jgi:transcriptional regulator with XRE-family HTH domain